MKHKFPIIRFAVVLTTVLVGIALNAHAADKVWEVTATKNQTFQVAGEKTPVIRAKAGQPVKLRITAFKGPEQAKDGSVHSFTIKALASQGWNLRLKEGTKDYTLTAPAKPGEYVIECAVKCGPNHADQRMKLIVEP